MIMPVRKLIRKQSASQSANDRAYAEFVQIIERYHDQRKIAASVSNFARNHRRSALEYVEKEVPGDLPDLADVNLAYALGVLTGIMIKEYRRKK